MDNTDLHDYWEIVPHENATTNCTMPQYLLNRAIRCNWTLPLIFKITNPQTNLYTVCVADSFFETIDDKTQSAMISPIVIEYLKLDGIAEISILNQSPDLIPPKAKTIYLEPQSEIFYDIVDPKRILESCFEKSHYLAIDYMIPLTIGNQKTQIKIHQIIDEFDRETRYANIHNIDLNVDFLPLPEHLKIPKPITPTIIPKEKLKIKINDKKPAIAIPRIKSAPPPLYDPQKPWIPFCGWGRRLDDGEYIRGQDQNIN